VTSQPLINGIVGVQLIDWSRISLGDFIIFGMTLTNKYT